ncbi:MAG: PadR family transcriptional regulator [Cryobacterium sp.]|nr:PadR family transcriptional regulator [Cryobacterium sp.]
MSVRSSLLSILTMGPAYGFQLHGELGARTAGRRSVNVGQIYGTLERLVAQGAVESAGSTTDGLPLYRLTVGGRSEAVAWLHGTTSSAGEDWNEMLERVLIASSLPDVDVGAIVGDYREAWAARLRSDAQTPARLHDAGGLAGLSLAADDALAHAALTWLDTVSARLAASGDEVFHRELSLERPKRGRRPALTPAL